jgi:hypothetical protein
MRVRILDSNLDMTFGQSEKNFYINSPEAVGQVVLTSLKLFQGEFFLNTDAGVPYFQGVLGKYDQATADRMIQDQIMLVEGVTGISDYSSVRNQTGTDRSLTVNVTINTLYGPTDIELANYRIY